MITYIDVIFGPGGSTPGELIQKMSGIGVKPLFGPHDFAIEWNTQQEFQERFRKVREILDGCKLSYRLITYEQIEEKMQPINVLTNF